MVFINVCFTAYFDCVFLFKTYHWWIITQIRISVDSPFVHFTVDWNWITIFYANFDDFFMCPFLFICYSICYFNWFETRYSNARARLRFYCISCWVFFFSLSLSLSETQTQYATNKQCAIKKKVKQFSLSLL